MTGSRFPSLSAALCDWFATLLAQTVSGNSATLVRAVADDAPARTGVRAASVLWTGGEVLHARAGEWPIAASARLDAWERALLSRAKRGAADLPEGPIPVSTAQSDEWMLCMAPLAAGGRAVGALSFCVEAARAEDAIRSAQGLSPWLGTLIQLTINRENSAKRLAALGQLLRLSPESESGEWRERLRSALRLFAGVFQASGSLVVALSESGDSLQCLAADIPNEALDWTGARFKTSGVLHHVCISGETVLTNAAVEDPRYAPTVEGALVDSLRSILAGPVKTPNGQPGALALLNSRSLLGFSYGDSELLQSAAAWISALLQNTGQDRVAADARDQMGEIQRSLREDIASTLHQGPIQLLAAVTMGMDHLEHLAAAQPDSLPAEIKALKNLTREATFESRLLLSELHPSSLDGKNLVDALEAYAAQLSRGSESISIEHAGPMNDLDGSVARAAFYASVQGMRHACTHGDAAHVWVSLSLADEALTIVVEDDGKPHAERRCARQTGMDCPAFLSQQLVSVRGALETRSGGPGSKPALIIRIPARSR